MCLGRRVTRSLRRPTIPKPDCRVDICYAVYLKGSCLVFAWSCDLRVVTILQARVTGLLDASGRQSFPGLAGPDYAARCIFKLQAVSHPLCSQLPKANRPFDLLVSPLWSIFVSAGPKRLAFDVRVLWATDCLLVASCHTLCEACMLLLSQ